MSKVTLITGGARSGKSARAIALANAESGTRKFFIATAEALDDEMRDRIARHQRDRGGAFETIEEPIEVAHALEQLDSTADVVVLDCLTLWISNLMGRGMNDAAILSEADRLSAILARRRCDAFIVTDEVGGGIVPMEPVGRRFRDLLGWANQKVARVADRVILMVAGYEVPVKS